MAYGKHAGIHGIEGHLGLCGLAVCLYLTGKRNRLCRSADLLRQIQRYRQMIAVDGHKAGRFRANSLIPWLLPRQNQREAEGSFLALGKRHTIRLLARLHRQGQVAQLLPATHQHMGMPGMRQLCQQLGRAIKGRDFQLRTDLIPGSEIPCLPPGFTAAPGCITTGSYQPVCLSEQGFHFLRER